MKLQKGRKNTENMLFMVVVSQYQSIPQRIVLTSDRDESEHEPEHDLHRGNSNDTKNK